MVEERKVPAKPTPRRVLRVIGIGLVGALLGAAAGGLTGGIFMLVYRPHGGGDVGDWTSFIVLVGAVLVGAALGLVSGGVWGVIRRPMWQLAAGLGAVGVVAGLLFAALWR